MGMDTDIPLIPQKTEVRSDRAILSRSIKTNLVVVDTPYRSTNS